MNCNPTADNMKDWFVFWRERSFKQLHAYLRNNSVSKYQYREATSYEMPVTEGISEMSPKVAFDNIDVQDVRNIDLTIRSNVACEHSASL